MRLAGLLLTGFLLSTGSAVAAGLATPVNLPYSWAGFYAGAQIGYSFGNDRIADEFIFVPFVGYNDYTQPSMLTVSWAVSTLATITNGTTWLRASKPTSRPVASG